MVFKVISNWAIQGLCFVALMAAAGCQAGSPLVSQDKALNGPEPSLADLSKGTAADVLDMSNYISLSAGLNEDIRLNQVLDNSANAGYGAIQIGEEWQDAPLPGTGGAIQPILEYGMELASTPDEMSFATYGFRDIPDGLGLQKIHITGTPGIEGYCGNGLFSPGQGLYIGLSEFGDGAHYSWYGPFSMQDEYDLEIWDADTTNHQDLAYLTIAVCSGDYYALFHMDITVGATNEFEVDKPDFDPGMYAAKR